MKRWWQDMQGRWQELLEEYGRVAIGTFVAIWLLSIATYAGAIWLGGIEVEGASGLGAVVVAWGVMRVTWPFRVAATLVLTPFVAAGLRRFRPEEQPAPAEERS